MSDTKQSSANPVTQGSPQPGQKLGKPSSSLLDFFNPYTLDKLKDKGLQPILIEESAIKRTTAKIFFTFFAFFLAWAFYAPIDAGVTMQGTVIVLGNRKSVQHPSGGVVQEILVKDGDQVKAGDVLLRVNPLKSEADTVSVELQYINLLATESRLKSERDGLSSVEWSSEFIKRYKKDDPRISEAKRLQQQYFDSRRAEFASQVSSLNEQINALNASLKSKLIQQRTLTEELSNTNALAKDGFVPQNQANLAERTKSENDSVISTTQAEIARAKLSISQIRGTFVKDVDNQLQEIQKNRDALLSRLDAAKFDRNLAQVKAPVDGSVVGLKVFTVGGVIGSGAVLLEIVPENERLVIQTKVPNTIIDKVAVGMITDLRFSNFNKDTTPVVQGIVKTVGADKESGANPSEAGEFYMAQVEVTPEGLKELGALKIQPGMSVDVIVKSGTRSFMSYLLKPIVDKAAKAFQ